MKANTGTGIYCNHRYLPVPVTVYCKMLKIFEGLCWVPVCTVKLVSGRDPDPDEYKKLDPDSDKMTRILHTKLLFKIAPQFLCV